MKSTDPLPAPYPDLIQRIKANSPDTGGENRAAVAELEARTAVAQDNVATRLVYATWSLVGVTGVLAIATIVLVVRAP